MEKIYCKSVLAGTFHNRWSNLFCHSAFFGKGSADLSFFRDIFCNSQPVVRSYTAKEYQSAKDQLLAQEKVYAYDEDDYWSFGIWGLRYYNPYDPQVLKENNSGGLNQTVNMAQASGKWMAAGTILFLAVISLFVAWQFAYPAWLDRQGKLADMEIQADTLKVESPLYKAEIPVEEIMRAELSYDLGEGSKTNGSATGHYGAGKFRYDRYGDVTVYAAWKHKPYLILFAKDEVYIINDDDPEVTLGIYEKVSRGKEAD